MRGKTTLIGRPQHYKSERTTLPVIVEEREKSKGKTNIERGKYDRNSDGGENESGFNPMKQLTVMNPQGVANFMSTIDSVPLRQKTENAQRRRRNLVDVDVVRQIIIPIKHIKSRSNKRVPYMEAFNTRLENMRLAQRLLSIKPSEDVSKKHHHRFYSRHRDHVEMLMHDGEEVMITNYSVIKPKQYWM